MPGVVKVLDKALVVLFVVAYALLLASLAIAGDARIWKAIVIPAAVFLIVTLLRMVLDRARPYEEFDIEPLIEKDDAGRSFPSRHMSSSVAIAFALSWTYPPLALPAVIACLLVVFTRLVGGVHFPRDLIWATIVALAICLLGFLVVP